MRIDRKDLRSFLPKHQRSKQCIKQQTLNTHSSHQAYIWFKQASMVIPQFGKIITLLRYRWSNGEGVYFILSWVLQVFLLFPWSLLGIWVMILNYLAMSSHQVTWFDLLKSTYSWVEKVFRRWFEKSKRTREELEYKSLHKYFSFLEIICLAKTDFEVSKSEWVCPYTHLKR
jgi:hypothetical protein